MESEPQTSQRMEAEKKVEEADPEIHQSNKELRPKRNQLVEFKVDGINKVGKVTNVGKVTGKDKNRCWIRLRNTDKTEESHDFVKDVQTWKVIEKVTFSNQTMDNRAFPSQRMDVENDTHGIWFLSHKTCCVEEFENP